MQIKWILLAILCLNVSVSYADTSEPKVVFNNGVSASINYFNEKMDQKNRFGYVFDSNPKTIWYYPNKKKSAILTIRSNDVGISGVRLNISCNTDQEVLFKTEPKSNIKISKNENYIAANLTDTQKKLKLIFIGAPVCINDMTVDLHDGKKGTAFIEKTGGGYPDVYLNARGRWVEHFSAGNVAASYFLKDGTYAVFILNADIGPLGGIRIVNVNTLKSIDYLKGELLDFDSIKWNDAEVSGIIYKPYENWREERFKIKIVFP